MNIRTYIIVLQVKQGKGCQSNPDTDTDTDTDKSLF